MKKLYLDTETYSHINLRTSGTHKYAEHAEVIMWQWAVGDGDVILADGSEMPSELRALLENPDYEIVIHHSTFDRTVIRHANGFEIPTNRIFDTMACALAHSLPGGLGELSELFGLDSDKAKDKEGKKLINLFCKPQVKRGEDDFRATKETHPIEWEAFRRYGERDIIAMREVDKLLPRWNFRDHDRKVWELDQRINDRGMHIDLDLVHAAIRASKRAKEDYAADTLEKTNGEVTSTSRRDSLLEYIEKAYGVVIEDLKSANVKLLLQSTTLPEGVLELLTIRLEACKSSIAKYPQLLRAISADGRLRNTLQFCGASRTGRWSGRLFQPQNLPRSSLKARELERAIAELKCNAEGLI